MRMLDLQVFWIIERLLVVDPPTIVKYVKNHFRDLRPLGEEIAEMQNGDAGSFLLMATVGDPEELPKIQGLIHAHFKKFPVATMLDFGVASPDMK
jgi:hypothetical protein